MTPLRVENTGGRQHDGLCLSGALIFKNYTANNTSIVNTVRTRYHNLIKAYQAAFSEPITNLSHSTLSIRKVLKSHYASLHNVIRQHGKIATQLRDCSKKTGYKFTKFTICFMQYLK